MEDNFSENQLKIKELFNKNELRRLEKAAKDKDKRKLIDWARQFEEQIQLEYSREYQKQYKEEVNEAIDNFVLTIIYTLHFNEKTKFGNARIQDFMKDLFVTIDLFRTKEYTPEEYREILKKEGIIVKKSEGV